MNAGAVVLYGRARSAYRAMGPFRDFSTQQRSEVPGNHLLDVFEPAEVVAGTLQQVE